VRVSHRTVFAALVAAGLLAPLALGVSATDTITTVAGTGMAGFSGDGGPATSAQLRTPLGLALDAAGNLYIAEQLNHRVRRVSPGGTITTVAGTGTAGISGDGGPAIAAQLNQPLGVALDAGGNLYIADFGNSRIRRLGSDGIITTVAGTGVSGYSGDNGAAASAQLSGPAGVALDGAGNLYIADTNNNRIRVVRPTPVLASRVLAVSARTLSLPSLAPVPPAPSGTAARRAQRS
jgi:NHL repeat-containing protein